MLRRGLFLGSATSFSLSILSFTFVWVFVLGVSLILGGLLMGIV